MAIYCQQLCCTDFRAYPHGREIAERNLSSNKRSCTTGGVRTRLAQKWFLYMFMASLAGARAPLGPVVHYQYVGPRLNAVLKVILATGTRVSGIVCRIGAFIPQISYPLAVYLFEAARALRGLATHMSAFYCFVRGAGLEPAMTTMASLVAGGYLRLDHHRSISEPFIISLSAVRSTALSWPDLILLATVLRCMPNLRAVSVIVYRVVGCTSGGCSDGPYLRGLTQCPPGQGA